MGKRDRRNLRRPPKQKSGPSVAAKPKSASGTVSGNVVPSSTQALATDLADDFVLYDSGADGSVRSGEDCSSSECSSSSDEMELAAGEGVGGGSDVEVTFDFYDPAPVDEGPLVTFLGSFCDSCAPPVGSNERYLRGTDLAQAICAQTRVGTVVKISDDAQAIGFITVLNMEVHRDLLVPFGKHLRRVCGVKDETSKAADNRDKTDGEKFYAVLAHSFSTDEKSRGARVGLIITDRVVNLPPQLVPKIQEALFCEVEWAQEDEPTAELREMYNFHWYLYVTDVYAAGEGKSIAEGEKGKKPAKKKARSKGNASEGSKKTEGELGSLGKDEIAFTRVEDEMYLAASTHTVMWPVAGVELGPGGIRKMKIGMLIKKARIAQAVAAVRRVFGVQDEEESGPSNDAEEVVPMAT